jgi:tetraacyldisaccharide 4'-kinase
VAGAQYAVHERGAELVILDDGFQHRRLARDLDIVLVDALAPWGYDYLLPRGLLREPSRSLRRAGLVVITRADRISPDEIDLIRLRIAQADPRLEVVQVAFPPERLIGASGQTAALDALRGTEIAAFCGIGNPDAFRAGLERLGYRVTAFRSFPDHHRYSPGDLDELARWAATVGATALVTTQKDLVKIRRDSLGDRPLWAIQIGTQITDGAERLEARLEEVLGRRSEA